MTIQVNNLSKSFEVPIKQAGLKAALANLINRQTKTIAAVQNLSFTVEPGELVGFLGPNGAGKTTTLKMLSGILHPTSGKVMVLGHTPYQREAAFLKQIAMVRGSRPLGLPGELTVADALKFQQLLYEIDQPTYQRNLHQLTELLQLEPLLQRQLRALSLGERMKAGLAAALIYGPKVLFLDEPTIGLDVTSVSDLRRFIKAYNQETQATILLTSHYMADVAALCPRILLIDQGQLTYDGPLDELTQRYTPHKLLKVTTGATPPWATYGQVVQEERGRVTLLVPRPQIPEVTARLLSELPVADLSVEEPPLEELMGHLYRQGVAQ